MKKLALVLSLCFCAPAIAKPACKVNEASDIVVATITQGDDVLWQSSAMLAEISEGTLCAAPVNNKVAKQFNVVTVKGRQWLFNTPMAIKTSVEKPSLSAKFSAFKALASSKASCVKDAVLTSQALDLPKGDCAYALKGLQVSFSHVVLNEKQQKRIKVLKEKAEERRSIFRKRSDSDADKRMKKF